MKIIDNIKLILAEYYNYSLRKKPIQPILKKNGILIHDRKLDDDTTDKLYSKAMNLIKKNPHNVQVESNGSDMRIYGINYLDESFSVENIAPEILEIASQFYGIHRNKVKHFTMFGLIQASPDNLGSGSGWHRDSPFRHQFKCIIYLTDVTMENGPFEFIPESHSFNYISNNNKEHEINQHRFTDTQIDQENKISVCEKKGTMLLADTRGIHRGSPLMKNQRMALTFYMYANKIPNHFKNILVKRPESIKSLKEV